MSAERELPGLGGFVLDEDLGWLSSRERFAVPALPWAGQVVLHDPEADGEVVVATVQRFLALDAGAVEAAAPYVWAYYRDSVETGWSPDLGLAGPDDVWRHVRMPEEVGVIVDDGIGYVDLECECDWEAEHGLNLVFRGGDQLSKVGQYDGHRSHLGTDEIYPGAGPSADDQEDHSGGPGTSRVASWVRLLRSSFR